MQGRLFGICCFNYILDFHFLPYFTISCRFEPRVIIFHFFAFRRFSFFRFEDVVDFIFPSLSWSSHWSACLVSDAEAKVPFCCLLCHRSSGSDAILSAKRHFILLGVSIQRGIFASFQLL